jgi:hypothetical protein
MSDKDDEQKWVWKMLGEMPEGLRRAIESGQKVFPVVASLPMSFQLGSKGELAIDWIGKQLPNGLSPIHRLIVPAAGLENLKRAVELAQNTQETRSGLPPKPRMH